jgi:hypothetical protein
LKFDSTRINFSITVSAGLSYTVSNNILLSNSINNHIHGTVVAYNPINGLLLLNPTEITGQGSYNTWTINLDGSIGARGIDGLQGPAGIEGAVGATGETGLKGAVGNTGSQGVIGLTGSVGATGSTGLQGAIGNTGSQGTIGLTGAVRLLDLEQQL